MSWMKLTLYCISLVFLIGCTNDSFYDVNKMEETENTSVLPVTIADDDFIKYIVQIDSISDMENDIVIDKKIPTNLIPDTGVIVVIPPCKLAEFGFAGIVRKIHHNNNIEIITEAPSLEQFSEEIKLTDQDFDLEVFDVQDEQGNLIDYTLENKDSTAQLPVKKKVSSTMHAFENMIIRFPFESIISNDIHINGDVYMGFNKLSVSLLKQAGMPMISTFDIEPSVGLNIRGAVGFKGKKSYSKRIGQIRLILKAQIGLIPVIIPTTLFLYAEIGVNGEITTSFSFNPRYDGRYRISSESGKWDYSYENSKTNQVSPWTFTSFNVNGEVYMDLRMGILFGLYSASTGIGLNIIPKYSIYAEASLSSKNLFQTNPFVTNRISLNSEAYCVASFFGKKLAKATMEFPGLTLWEEKLSLFPEIKDFTAQVVDKTTGLISYKRNKRFFLENISASEGLSLFETCLENHVNDYKGNNIKEDDNCFYMEKHITGLKGETNYYVCPYYEIFGQKFYGDIEEFVTDKLGGKYKINILSCEYAKLVPPQTAYTFDVEIDSDGRFTKIVDSQNNDSFEKKWQFQNERIDNGTRSDVLTEDLFIRFTTYNGKPSGCMNAQHNHSNNESGIKVDIWYEYYSWYGFNIDGPHSRYVKEHDWRNVVFYLSSKCGTFSSCSGSYYVLSTNTMYNKLYQGSAKMVCIE